VSTVVVQIGNSDDRLTQSRWADFVAHTDAAVRAVTTQVHFTGLSSGHLPWQNACWVGEVISPDKVTWLRTKLADVAALFEQDSIALTVGSTEFVPGGSDV
jgi:hypothetical protein